MRPDRVTLAFDTSAAHCAAALLIGDRLAALRAEAMGRGQAERLFPMLEEVLADAGTGWASVGLIGVGVGPGNFTGIRIAVSAARGLALSLGVRAVGVSGLRAQAYGTGAPVIVSIAAPGGEVYAEAFPGAGAGPVRGAPEDIALELPAGAAPLCIGAAAPILAARHGGLVGTPALPLAEAIARIALFRRDATLARPAPLYLRSADAAPAADPPPRILP